MLLTKMAQPINLNRERQGWFHRIPEQEDRTWDEVAAGTETVPLSSAIQPGSQFFDRGLPRLLKSAPLLTVAAMLSSSGEEALEAATRQLIEAITFPEVQEESPSAFNVSETCPLHFQAPDSGSPFFDSGESTPAATLHN